MSQQSRPPWQTMPKDDLPAGYRPLLQQPYGQLPQPGPAKKRLPPIAWVGIGIGVLIVLVMSANGSNNGGDATATTTPFRTTATSAAAGTTPPQANTAIAPTARGMTPTASALPTARATANAPLTVPPAPTAAAQVVTVKESPVNVRQSPDPNAPIIATLDPATDAAVLGPDTTGPDGATRWVHVRAGDTNGYVRSDLVSAPHAAGARPEG